MLSGEVRDPRVGEKAVQLASSLGEGVQVLNNMSIPDPGQVLLQVRFAEVSRSWQQEIGPTLVTREGPDWVGAIGPVDNVRTPNQEGNNTAVAEVFWAMSWLVVLGVLIAGLVCVIRGLEGERFKIPVLGAVADRL